MIARVPVAYAAALLTATGTVAGQGGPVRLTFGDAVARAATGAPAVLAARFRGDAADARARQAAAALWPGLSAGASYTNRTFNRAALGISVPGAPADPLVGPFDIVDGRLYLQQPLLDFGARRRRDAARASAGAAHAGTDRTAELAAASAALGYLDAARAEAVVAARLADSVLAAELVTLARTQREADVAIGLDVTRAETQLVTAASGLTVARNARARTHLALARALGLEAEQDLELTDTLRADLAAIDLTTDRDTLVALARLGRPDLALRRAEAAAARAGVTAIAAERLPRLDLVGDVGLNGPGVADMIATRQVAVQVTLPVLDELRRRPRLTERRAQAAEAEVVARDLASQIAAEIDAARYDLDAAGAVLEIAAQGIRLATAELTQARERFAAGVAGNLELITAQVSLLRARDAEIDARYQAAAARVALAHAVGVAHTLGTTR
jgi:outer membrane protein TolC